MSLRLLAPILLLAVTTRSSIADDTWRLDANDATYAYVCGKGERLTLNGNGNTLTVSGECGAVEITGSDNHVVLELAASITIGGNNNDVVYGKLADATKKLAVKVKGAANSVRRSS